MSRDNAADRLAAFLDGLDVESLWIVGHHIDWETGEPDTPNLDGSEAASHCSAFVAALAERLSIYVLRPPGYPQELLANRQVHWLSGRPFRFAPSDAATQDWRVLGKSANDGVLAAAVGHAQAGRLVVAGFAQDPCEGDDGKTHVKPGHICVVRPQIDPIGDGGPFVISAGDQNFHKAHMARAFEAHDGAWPDGIALFVHDTRFSQADG